MLLGAGAALALVLGILAVAKRRVRSSLSIPAMTTHQIELTDILLAFAAVAILPSVFVSILGSLSSSGDPLTSAAATDAASPDFLRKSACVLLGQVAASGLMLLIGRSRFAGGLSGWGLSLDGVGRRFAQAVAAYVCIWPVCYGLLVATVWTIERIVPGFKVTEHESIALLIGPDATGVVRAITVTSALVMAAVQEELFFRGLLQQWLYRVTGSGWSAITITACAFGLFHWPLFHTMPALAGFGVLLGVLYFKTRSLTLVIMLHAVFNGKTLLWIALGAQP